MVGALVFVLFAIFLFWRIDSPRAEYLRARIIDNTLPRFDWIMVPVTKSAEMIQNFQSYTRLYEQNQELRRELQEQKRWKEAARQLEQQNAKLLDLNNVRLDPKLSYVTGIVLADSGSPFRQSVLLNIGARDGLVDGWAATDGLGLVGRISGVGNETARVILLTDSNSRIPVTIQPSGEHAIVVGDNSARPPLDFIETDELVRPGDRVVSSGDGAVFPADILLGHVAQDPSGRLRVILAADYERLDLLRVLRALPRDNIVGAGELVLPDSENTTTTGEEPADG